MSLSPQLDREYSESFGLVDKDGDGLISKDEFIQLIIKVGIANPKKEAEKMWATGGAGTTMNVDQYKKAFVDTFIVNNKKAEILSAFEVFDYEKCGKIHESEVALIFSQMGNQLDSEEIKDLIKLLEPDKEGKCDYRDFTERMFTACREK